MTEQTERVNVNKYALLLSEEVRKTFAIFEPGTQFNRAGFTSSKHGFLGWTGMILNAKLEGLPDGEVIAEGKMKGKIGIDIPDVETFERVVARLRAYQEANPRQERGERGERTERPVDLRKQLSNRIANSFADLKAKQATAERNHWGVDYSEFLKTLEGINFDSLSLIAGPVDEQKIGEAQARLSALDDGVRLFEETEVIRDRISCAKSTFEDLRGSIPAPVSQQLHAAISSVEEKAEAGDSKGAHALLYKGDDAVFPTLARVRNVVGAANSEPERRGRNSSRGGSREGMQFGHGSPQAERAAVRAARKTSHVPRDSRR